MDIIVWLVLPGVVLLVLEWLITGLTNARTGCLVIPILAAIILLFTLCATAVATGWDSLGWGVLSMIAGSGLIGSLLGGVIGLIFRKLCRRKEKQHHETDQTV